MGIVQAEGQFIGTLSSFHSFEIPADILLVFVYFTPGGVMTFHDYGYLPPGYLKSYPVSE